MARLIPFGKPMIGNEEKQAVLAVLGGSTLVHGPKTVEFEENFAAFTGAPHAVSVANCTAAMHLFYFCLGLKAGDEVIVPAQTHTATAHAVELTGAKPVFVDAEPITGNIDIDLIEQCITPQTRAISVVHFLGTPVDMTRVNKIADKHDLRIIEDCALAIGTRTNGGHAGLSSDCGCFSFYPVKHMTTAEGGMLITRNEELANQIKRTRAFSVDRHVGERVVPGMYDVTGLGFNYRMNEIEAAIGIEQLKRMDCFLQKRAANHMALSEGFAEIDQVKVLESTSTNGRSSHYCLSVILNNTLAPKRFEIIQGLKNKGVGTSVYYPKAVPHMKYYREKYGYRDGDFPVAALIGNQSIALPVGPHLTTDDMQYIIESFKNTLTEVK